MEKETDTIVALSTPFGESGIGVIRLSGPLCFALVQEIFKRKEVTFRHSYFGRYYNVSGDILDEVVFVCFEENASYTGECMLEISCHGNPLIIRLIIQDCIERGCRQALPGEFTRRAFLNGVLDLCQAESVADLIHAKSEQSIKLAQKQLQGSLSSKIQNFIETLTEQVAMVEAYLDFPEEDLPEADIEKFKEQLKRLMLEIDSLIREQAYYPALNEGIHTVILGAPNAGKSTLLNTLLGHERAIVSDIPGTTRDFISENVSLDCYHLHLLDTAGIHESMQQLECAGIKKTLEQLHKADFVILVIDQSQPVPEFSKEVWEAIKPESTLILWNKTDLPKRVESENLFESFNAGKISLKASNAFDLAKRYIVDFLEQRYHHFSNVQFMIHERHAKALTDASQAIQNAFDLFQRQGPDDCIAAELKLALRALEGIVGRMDYEKVLDQIFSRFCIGK